MATGNELKRRIRLALFALCLSLVILSGALADLIPLSKPGASRTYPMGIQGDTIVGYYDWRNGFTYDISDNKWTDFSIVADGTSRQTVPYKIDDQRIVGHYSEAGGGFVGFLYDTVTEDPDRKLTTFDFASETIAFDLDGNYVIGNYGTPGDYDGFIYTIGTGTPAPASPGTPVPPPPGTWSTLNTPEGSTYLTGIALDAGTAGIITGSAQVSGGYKSWLYDMGGHGWTPFRGPHGEEYTFLYGIDGNYIIGAYDDGASPWQGFFYDMIRDSWTLLDFGGAVGTYPQGNDGLRIVGYYDLASDPGNGFLCEVPAPGAVVLAWLGIGTAAMKLRRRGKLV